MMRNILLGTVFLFFTYVITGQKRAQNSRAIEFPMTEKYWESTTDNVEFITYKSVSAVKSNNDRDLGIMLKDFEFINGTIEYDVEFKGRGFPGVDFRVDESGLNSEKVYIRYFGAPNDVVRTTLQYACVLDGVNMWDVSDEYQAAASIKEGENWNHVKLVVHGNQMKVYVNNMQYATLHVPGLEGRSKSGTIALSGNVIYANFKVIPDATEDVAPAPGYDPTYSDTRYLKKWMVSQPVDFPLGKALMGSIDPRAPGLSIDSTLYNSTIEWKPLKAERRALVNLTRLYGGVDRGHRKLVWIKATISSEVNQEKRIDLGFSDEVWVFINGEPLYEDKNHYGSPGMKEPRGRCTIDNSSFALPLKEGENEMLIGVTNYFFGWGIIARINNTDGLSFL